MNDLLSPGGVMDNLPIVYGGIAGLSLVATLFFARMWRRAKDPKPRFVSLPLVFQKSMDAGRILRQVSCSIQPVFCQTPEMAAHHEAAHGTGPCFGAIDGGGPCLDENSH